MNIAVSSWVTCPKPCPQVEVRLFCFPYAGGGTSVFHGWAAHLHPCIELYRVHLPGRENRITERPFTRLTAMVETLAEALRAHLNVPFAFFGHSMGALIGFELARQLRRWNEPGPTHLFVSGHRAPQLRDPDPPIHQLPEPAFVEELRRLNGTPEEVLADTELMQLVMPALRGDFAVCETYRYLEDDPVECPISAFGGVGDARVGHADLAAWRSQTSGAFVQRMLPGTHFFLHGARDLLLHAIFEDLSWLFGRRAHGLG